MKTVDWTQIKHFVPKEFDDPDYPGSWEHMDPDTIILLDVIREATGWPIDTHWEDRGCVCVESKGHSSNSRHYKDHPDGCSACDFHFRTNVSDRYQAMVVLRSGFSRVGIYYDWNQCSIGFHVDFSPRPQVWVRRKGKYFYLLK